MSTNYKTAYSSDKNRNTLDQGSYNDWGDLTPARQVLAKQAQGEVFDVNFVTTKGTTEAIYNEVSSIVVGAETLINQYTIPTGQALNLNRILVSGENISKYIVKINGAKVGTIRTWWSQFNSNLPFDNLKLSADDVISVHVINNGSMVSDYESTILGDLYNV